MSVQARLEGIAAVLLGAGGGGVQTADLDLRTAAKLIGSLASLLGDRTPAEVRVLIDQLAANPPRPIDTTASDARVDAAVAARFPRDGEEP
jgi:hypothetical protein